MSTVRVPAHMVAWMMEHASEAFPGEACGVFLGTRNGITSMQRLANVAEDPKKGFAFDSAQTLAVYQDAENQGLKIVGTWHSHPTQAPIPSDRDKAGIRHPDLLFHVIVGRCFITQGSSRERIERPDYTDVRLYDAEWEEIDHIVVPALPFLTLQGVAQPTGEQATSDVWRA